MRILILASYYRPDGGPAAPLYTMLCEGLVRRGHEVTVITSVPHYPSGHVVSEYRNHWIGTKIENGVKVIRVRLPSVNRSKLMARMFQFIAYQVGATFSAITVDYDIILGHSPALEMWLPFMLHGALRRKPSVYSVHDVYPDVGIKLGYFRHSSVISLVACLERSCLMNSSKVRILSQSFEPSLLAVGVQKSSICLIYDWVETTLMKPLRQENLFWNEQGLAGRFVVLYAGNIGFVQGLDTVVETARSLSDDPDVCFIFVGDGSAKESLIEKACWLNLNNVRFVPYQPRERMPEILAAADVSLVSLRRGSGFGALPSKTFAILASGRPVIASVDPESDTWDLVTRAKAGLCIEPESPLKLLAAIRSLKNDPQLRTELGQNGRAYVLRNHSPESAAKAFEELLLEATG